MPTTDNLQASTPSNTQRHMSPESQISTQKREDGHPISQHSSQLRSTICMTVPTISPRPNTVLPEKEIKTEGGILDIGDERNRSSQDIDEESGDEKPRQSRSCGKCGVLS